MTWLIDTPDSDGMQAAPECFEPRLENAAEMNGMEWLQVFSACQALMSPANFYHVRRRDCKKVIKDIMGFLPPKAPGTPGKAKGWRGGGKKAIYEWLNIAAVCHDRNHTYAVGRGDRTIVLFKD